VPINFHVIKPRIETGNECYLTNTLVLSIELQSVSSQDEECANWKWDTSKTKLWNEDTQRKHGI